MHKQLKFLLAVAFVEGASVMAVELSGAKLIAPYFGTSLYVWASVIGVTMMGLALGYFLGGRMSEKMEGPEKLFLVLAGAAFFTALMPLDSSWIMEATLNMEVRWGSLLSAMVFLMPPMFLFGMVSPLIIRLGALETEQAGKVSGFVFALSTVGGIAATFLMGFYLIPEWGLRRPLWLFASLLFLLPIIYWGWQKNWRKAAIVVILAALAPGLNWAFGQPYANNDKIKIQKEIEGLNGNLTIVDEWKGKDSVRTLFLNGRPQTMQYFSTGCPGHNYVLKLANLAGMFPNKSRVLLLGLGGGTLVQELAAFDHDIVAVELDPRMQEVGTAFFNLDPEKCKVVNDDARHFLNTVDSQYDCILVDVFFGDNPPGHVITQESLVKMKDHLAPNGLIAIYFPGPIEGPGSLPSQGLISTLRRAGFSVAVLATETQGFGGRTFIATKKLFSYQNYPHLRASPCAELAGVSPVQPLTTQFQIDNPLVFSDDRPLSESMFTGPMAPRRHF